MNLRLQQIDLVGIDLRALRLLRLLQVQLRAAQVEPEARLLGLRRRLGELLLCRDLALPPRTCCTQRIR